MATKSIVIAHLKCLIQRPCKERFVLSGVIVAIIIHNHSGHKMILEDVDISCGMLTNTSSMPEYLYPDGSYIVYTEKVRKSLMKIKKAKIQKDFRYLVVVCAAEKQQAVSVV